MRTSVNNAGIQVFGFIVILFVALFLYKYFFVSTSDVNTYQINEKQQTKLAKPVHKTESKVKDIDRPDDTINMNSNDLQIVNKKFNMYDNQEVSTYGFENELTNKTIINKSFAPELLELYDELMMEPINEDSLETEYTKAQKSDLPIANVPAYLLTNNEPLRLSEKPKV